MKCLLVLSVIVAVVSAASPRVAIKPTVPVLPTLAAEPKPGRITNGEIASEGQFPYQCGLSLAFGTSSGWCGCSIISDRWVLTAAHCADGADGATVYLGAWDIYNKNEASQQRIYSSAANMRVHEEWDSATLTNDIALIKLPVKIDFNDHIKAVTLPKKSNTYSDYEGEMVVASGWGRDSDEATSVSQYLRFIEVPVMAYRPCNVRFFGMITDKMICIDTEGAKSTCNGDSGGPLVHKENGENVLVGATSFGISLGCEAGWPGVFTRITSYVDWIEATSGVVNK